MSNENNNQNNRLTELRGSGYEIVEGEPDIRGWEVRNAQGQTIGKVKELLFDHQSLKVRYVVVDLKGEILNLTSRDILIPIGLAELHEEGDDVILPDVSVGQLASLPDYKKGALTADTERSIRNVFAGTGLEAATAAELPDELNSNDSFYNHQHFDEDKMYNRRKYKMENETSIPVIEENINVGKRTVETGGVRLRKNVVEQPVEESVQLKEEHVTVARNSVDKPLQKGNFVPFEETSIELTEYAEVPVVSKEARVVEEVSVGKEVEQREETVRDTVRKTEVDVEEFKRDEFKNDDSRNKI